MAKLPGAINRESLEKPDEFSVLPKGRYDVIVSKTDYKTSKTGRETIELQLKVLNGSYAGRIIFASITTAQPLNESLPLEEAETKRKQALSIGEKMLNSLMIATDIPLLQDTDDFLNKRVSVEIKVTPARGEYPERNDVVKFLEYTGDTLPTGITPNITNPKPQTSKPWENVRKEANEDEAPGERPW